MKALVLRGVKQPLTLEDRPIPSAGPGELLVRVMACGICHGDLVMQYGVFPFVRFPVVPGHEIAGIVESVGAGVGWAQPGQRVGISVVYSTCQHCKQCLGGNENLCSAFEWTGMMHDGGYQQFVVVKADFAVPLPESLDFAEAAPLMCGGLTVYSGLIHGGFKPGGKVAVIGLGGLGILGVLFAKALGARVAVLSTSASKRALAEGLGAEKFIDCATQAPSEALQSWEGGADIILATAPAVEPSSAAFAGLAPDGTMVVVGVGPGNIAINPMDLTMGRRRLIGSPAGSRKELMECLNLAAHHKIRPTIRKFSLDQAAEAFAEMESGHIGYRAVLMPN